MKTSKDQLTAGELFAGYGGLALAVERALNATTAWVCEFEEPPSKILAQHFPEAPNFRDVTAVDWATVPPVDIISGGSPCQDVSLAGSRRGMTDGTRSNLWVSMREAIKTIQPRLVVWENVKGARSATASSDLEPCPGCMGTGGVATPNLLCGHSDVYSAILPPSGIALNGALYEHQTSARRTTANGSSSSPGATIPTPTATDGARGGKNPYKDTRSALLLPDWVNAITEGVPLTRKEIQPRSSQPRPAQTSKVHHSQKHTRAA